MLFSALDTAFKKWWAPVGGIRIRDGKMPYIGSKKGGRFDQTYQVLSLAPVGTYQTENVLVSGRIRAKIYGAFACNVVFSVDSIDHDLQIGAHQRALTAQLALRSEYVQGVLREACASVRDPGVLSYLPAPVDDRIGASYSFAPTFNVTEIYQDLDSEAAAQDWIERVSGTGTLDDHTTNFDTGAP